jgi:alpha-methylacyl-CoA racemase
LSPDEVPNQFDIGAYPEMRKVFAERFASKTRDQWSEIFAGTDACVTPVLTWTEAAQNERSGRPVIQVNGVERRRTGRARAALLPQPVRAGGRIAERHYTHR